MIYFDHEKLNVYQEALKFAAWCEPIIERIPFKSAVSGQLDRARTSVVLNIAEGNGKLTTADRCRYFDIAWGSALECASCLDLLRIKSLLNEEEVKSGKESLRRIVSMLVGLIKSHAPDRLKEDGVPYRAEGSD